MTSKIVVNNIEADAGVSTVTFNSKVASSEFVGNVTGNATGLSGSPTLSGITSISTTNLTVNGNAYPSTGPLSNRNRWINGDMAIDQRRNGSSQTNAQNVDYVVDRLRFEGVNSKCTIGQNLNSVTPPVGFKKYAGVEVTSTHTITSSDHFNISRWIEGYDVADFELGTANAKQFTVSFWVRSSVTGTYGLSFLGYDGSTFRHYVREYTIDSANTWEHKTLTIQGDTSTTITWNTTNGAGLFLEWSLGTGTNVQTTADTWTTGLYRSSSNQTNLFATNGATFYLTGVQVELGTVATPFEHRSYGQELALCQRYYQTTGASGAPTNAFGGYVGTTYPNNASSYGTARFHVPMRATPAVVLYDGAGTSGTATQNGTANGISASASHITIYGFTIVQKTTGVWTDDARYTIYAGYTASSEI